MFISVVERQETAFAFDAGAFLAGQPCLLTFYGSELMFFSTLARSHLRVSDIN